MLYMLISRTRPNLSPEDYGALGALAAGFYENVPEGLTLRGDWAADDGSRTFSLLESESLQLLEQVMEPFRAYTDIEVIAVSPIKGWGKR